MPRRGRALALLVLLVAVLFALRVALRRPLPVQGPAPDDGYVRVPGVLHVHTTLSDGGGSPEEVIRAARAAGLRFVVITDHNNLDAKPFEGYHDGVLVLVGTEISTTAGHVLGLGIPDPVYRFSGDARDALEDVRDLGGFAFAAHPLSPRPDLRFTGWDLPGPWGLELMNGDSEWRQAGARLAWTGLLYGLNHSYALLQSLSPPEATLARWDELLARRDVPGIVAADAHSRVPVTRKRSIRWPSYEALFRLAQNYVLLDRPLSGEAVADARAVFAAIRHGRLYLGLPALAPADGFSFVAEAGGRRFTMGETAPPIPNLVLKSGGRSPAGTRLALKRDGRPLAEGRERLEVPVPGPGVYRVEARVGGQPVPWVLSNPIYVFDEAARAERERQATWPADPLPPTPAFVIDSFEGKTGFQPEADVHSAVRRDVLEHAERGHGSATCLEFRLGVPGPGHPHTFCALVDRTPRDLTGRSGLEFSVRADGEYRMWVQVRDENPASRDDGTEWWFASVRTTREWRRVALSFARFRSINPHTDGRLDLDKVRALVFVLDRGAVKVGTQGTICLAELGVY